MRRKPALSVEVSGDKLGRHKRRSPAGWPATVVSMSTKLWLYSYSDLGRLSDAESRTLLVGPAALQGVKYREDALELVVAQSGGYPYFLQEYGRVLWDEVEEAPVTRSDVEAVTELVDDSLDRAFFGPAFDLATDAERCWDPGLQD